MSQETLSVSRATAITALRSLVSDLRTLANGAAIDRTNSAVADLKHSLDAPASPAGGEVEESFEYRLACLGSIDRCDIACGSYGDKFQRWDDAGPYVEHDDHVRHIEFYAFEVECLNTKVTRLQAENAALQQRLNVADQRVDELEAALKFYADKDHYHFDEPDKWDSVSGEAENLLWHEEDPVYIEDGSVARNALKVKP